jgi:glutamyl-tRNA synthetase
MKSPIRVRFAPSPTGKLHVGGARTALFNWAYARGRGGQFLLRIEDTDPERSTKEFETAILEGLRWLGIDWDEGPDVGGPHAPYHQRLRIERHREYATRLHALGRAYRCFCSRERLEELSKAQEAAKQRLAYDGLCRRLPQAESDRRAADEPFVTRFAVPEGETRFFDHVRGECVFQNAEVEDWVMVRSDGNPTYNFVVVCDDIDMEITHVFRGEEHLVNTPKQVLLYKAFEAKVPEFGHLPLMLGTDKKKLSKRTGDTALQDYRDKGYPKAAIVNFLCLQGWAIDGERVVFSVDELVQRFDIKDVQKAGAIFDLDKFIWLAGEYIRHEPLETLAANCAPFVLQSGLMSAADIDARREWWLSIVAAERERLRTYADLVGRMQYLFAPDVDLAWDAAGEAAARKHEIRVATLSGFHAWLAERAKAGYDPVKVRDEAKQWVAAQGWKIPQLFQPLRLALSGQMGGPDVFDMIGWLGVERSLARIADAARRLL